MHVWFRGIAATAAGLVAGIVLIMAVQALGVRLYPLPPGIDLGDPAAMARVVRDAPLGALLMVELSYAAGSLAAGITVGLLARRQAYLLAGVLGGLLTVAGFANLAAIPHPAWFAVVSTATYIPGALLGVLGVQRRRAGLVGP